MAVRRGKQYYMTSVKLGPKGQIVIPKEVRDMFKLESGDALLLMADEKRGIAIQSARAVQPMIDQAFASRGTQEEQARAEDFASAVKNTIKDSEEEA